MPGSEKGRNQFFLLNVCAFLNSIMDMPDPVFCSIFGKWVLVNGVPIPRVTFFEKCVTTSKLEQRVKIFKLEQVGQTSLGNV
jgi:hypothetical protein